jgi:hypothetical protein
MIINRFPKQMSTLHDYDLSKHDSKSEFLVCVISV